MSAFSVVNVVWYDGVDAYVSKFVLPCENGKVTDDGRKRCIKYLDGNGKVLEFDSLYPITFDNLIAFKDSDDLELQRAFDRYREMFFTV